MSVRFESAKEKDEEKRLRREQKKEAQKQYLEKVKSDYERNQKKKEEARKRGEDTWMLPSLNERLEEESDSKKKKKHKKEKKKKKKHKKKKNDSSSESADEWVEKVAETPEAEVTSSTTCEPMKRDDWLMAGDSFVPTFSRDDLRAKIKADKEEKQRELQQTSGTKDLSLDQPGLHHLELNPFWKDGGTGLPEEDKQPKTVGSGIGDGGVGWLKKALARVEEQAKSEGRSLEELAAEKWGSLGTIKKMIAEAEAAERKSGTQRYSRRSGSRERRRSRSRDRGDRFRRKSRSRSRERKRSRSRSPRRSRDRKRRKSENSDSSSDDSPPRRSKKSRSRTPRRRSRSRSRSPRRRSRSRSRSPRRRSRSRSRSPRRKSRSRSRSPRRRSRSPKRDTRPRFMKPGEADSSTSRFRKPDDERKAAFRKPGYEPDDAPKSRFRKPGEEGATSRDSPKRRSESTHVPGWKKPKPEPERQKSPPAKEYSSSSSSSSENEEEEATPAHEPVKILSETEMNALGAKIVKAELMGDDDRAAELKAQLDAARAAAAAAPKAGATPKTEPETIVLSRTTKSGVTMPLNAAQHDQWGGRKAKKRKVATHSKSGERERYFADDDKFTLKQMFQREKLGTSEDSNRMFARLAGRGVEKTDDDYQIDDAYLKRATGEQSEAQLEQQERASAISQHKKLSQAIEKCHYCLDKCAKHLIIAIGVKSYISLPYSASLTEGHCQIIPIEHSPCATQLDEDVWNEMQVFRKTLTKLFEEKDLDCVFMETALGLHRHPHMIIECIPMPRETGDMAPIYFKKAIQEHGSEWAQNQKLVDIRQKSIRNSVPKGFPYFSVDFGLEGGFAHVIEDEQTFSRFFGKEIIGGMLDVEPRLWRKGQKECFEDQRKKVLQFAEWWKPYDWTVTIKKKD